MSDVFSREKRSQIMASVRVEDTTPEMAVRRALWAVGVRYRTNVGDLPGTPDIAHKGAKVAVLIDGCFWHGCPECYEAPDSNTEFWKEKLNDNRQRRREVLAQLENMQFTVLQFWECEVQNKLNRVVQQIASTIQK